MATTGVAAHGGSRRGRAQVDKVAGIFPWFGEVGHRNHLVLAILQLLTGSGEPAKGPKSSTAVNF